MAKRNQKRKKNVLFGITSRVLMLIVAALLALSYLSIVINPAHIWLVSLSGLMFVPLMTLNLLLLFWAFYRYILQKFFMGLTFVNNFIIIWLSENKKYLGESYEKRISFWKRFQN